MFYKKYFGCLIAASTLALADIALSQELSATLYAGSNRTENFLDFYGDISIRERAGTGSFEVSGNIAICRQINNYSDIAIYDPNLNQTPPDSHCKFHDSLAPVNNNKASSVEVSENYCAILADRIHFDGAWEVYGKGFYNLKRLNNDVSAIATYYKPGTEACNPEKDIPMLYDGTNLSGKKFPLALNSGFVDPESTELFTYRTFLDRFSSSEDESRVRLASGLITKRKELDIQMNGADATLHIVDKGFANKASSLSVPKCYEVTLTRFDANNPLNIINKTFGPGTYNHLSDYSIDNSAYMYKVKRDRNCLDSSVVKEELAAAKSYLSSGCSWSQPVNHGYATVQTLTCQGVPGSVTKASIVFGNSCSFNVTGDNFKVINPQPFHLCTSPSSHWQIFKRIEPLNKNLPPN